MNGIEMALACAVGAVGATMVVRQRKQRGQCALLLILVPAVALLIPFSTQFLTVDEKAMVGEVTHLQTSPLKQWNNGAFRTSDIVIGSLMHLVRNFSDQNEARLASLAKAIHWFLGYCLLLVFIATIQRIWPAVDTPFFTMAMGTSALLLPTTATAFNMFNYDLFSMLLAALSCALVVRGVAGRSRTMVLAGVVSATLAAQEKLLATPVLWFAMLVYVVFPHAAEGVQHDFKARFLAALRASIEAMLCATAVIAVSYAVLLAVRGGVFPAEYHGAHPFKIVLPLFSPIVILVRGMAGMVHLEAVKEASLHIHAWQLWTVIAVSVAACMVIVSLCAAVACGSQLRRRVKEMGIGTGSYLPAFTHVLLVSTASIGIAATYLVHGFWAPAHPVSDVIFFPAVSFNGVFLHFDAPTAIEHQLRLLGWAYAVFYNAMPTALLVLALVSGTWGLCKRASGNLLIEATAAFCLVVPALFALANIPLHSRYFNLFLLLFLVVTIIRSALLLHHKGAFFRYGTMLTCMALLAVELFPFRPAFGMFRPIWSEFGARQNQCPEAGVINPVGHGGGEELMLAGERLKRIHDGRDRTITLYYTFYGAWLGDKGPVAVFDRTDPGVHLSFTESDYHLIDRLSVVQGWQSFPRGVPPEFTIDARGYIQAWVFRGDVLARHGYTFGR